MKHFVIVGDPMQALFQWCGGDPEAMLTPELPPEQFGSCSVDFRLGNEFSIFEHSRHAFIDLRDRRALDDFELYDGAQPVF